MQIIIPDDPKFESSAAAAGFATVEDYILAILEQHAQEQAEGESTNGQTLSHEQWKREFRAFQASLRPSNPNVDDSRESIYPVRD